MLAPRLTVEIETTTSISYDTIASIMISSPLKEASDQSVSLGESGTMRLWRISFILAQTRRPEETPGIFDEIRFGRVVLKIEP